MESGAIQFLKHFCAQARKILQPFVGAGFECSIRAAIGAQILQARNVPPQQPKAPLWTTSGYRLCLEGSIRVGLPRRASVDIRVRTSVFDGSDLEVEASGS